MKFRFMRKAAIGCMAGLMLLSLSACGNSSAQRTKNVNLNKQRNPSVTTLADANYRPGTAAYANVNHDKSTLNPRSWKSDHVIYSKLDHENRTSNGNTAFIDKKNLANDELRTRQVVYPTGYHQKRYGQGQYLVNRGHEIAYSLSKGISRSGKYNPKLPSGDQNNPRNLFTQTAFSNQKVQTIFESKVRNALRQGDKVVYQVRPIFQGRDKMAKGVHMQAVSTNRKLNFNVYLFNVQGGFKFNYANGTSKVDRAMKVPTPKGAPTFNNNGKKYRGRRASYRHGRYHYHHNWLSSHKYNNKRYRGRYHNYNWRRSHYKRYSHRYAYYRYLKRRYHHYRK